MHSKRFRSALMFLFLLLIGLGESHAQAAPEIILRPGDAVRLNVRDEKLLAGDYPVLASGQVLLPEIGFIDVAGRNFSEVSRDVRVAYERRIVQAQVTIVPLLRIAVLGEVKLPGLLPVDPTESVVDVIASAGGLTAHGNLEKVSILRAGQRTNISLMSNSPLGYSLRSGDQIIVGQRGWLRENATVLVGAGASIVAAAATSLIIRR